MDNRQIIIFDGVCNFCNWSVNFIIKRDPDAKFSFTPMQSDLAQELIEKHKISNVGVDTFLLISGDRCLIFTDAAIEIAKQLTGFWYFTTAFKIIPRFVRDWFYRMFARNRYKLFGRKDYCMVPSPEVKRRFIGLWKVVYPFFLIFTELSKLCVLLECRHRSWSLSLDEFVTLHTWWLCH